MAAITKEPSGYVDNTLITQTYDPATRKVTITSSSGFIQIAENRKIWTAASPIVTDAHTNPGGSATHPFFLTFSNGAFSWSGSPWEFYQVQIAAVTYNDSLTPKGFFIDEKHGLMQWQAHEGFHDGLGTVLISGGTIADYTLASTVEANQKFSIAQTVIKDEDIEHTLNTIALGGGNYTPEVS